MKRILLLQFFICYGVSAFSQYDYGREVFTAAEMNVKGKVKKITEIHVQTNKKGKRLKDEPGLKMVYEFDESGNIIKVDAFYLGEKERAMALFYEYKNGRVYKVSDKENTNEKNGQYYRYSTAAITVMNAAGTTLETRTLKDGRVTEIKTFPEGKSEGSYINIFDYNAFGQIEKQTHTNGKEYSSTFFSNYFYNTQGDCTREDRYLDGKISSTSYFEYAYDKNKNWSKCVSTYLLEDDEDDKEYESFTRTYEYY